MALNNPLNIHQIEAEAPPATSRAVEDALKDHYYRVDPAEYFERRLWGIIAMADLSPDSVKWDRDDEASLFGQFQAVLVNKKIALNVPPGTTLNSRTMASVESYALMQHVIETALRLFVAGQERVAGKSPMTTLINMRQSADLREPIKSLLSPTARHAVAGVMIPSGLQQDKSEQSKRDSRRHIDFLTAWLAFFARFYSETHFNGAQGNNQLKHGATLAPRDDLNTALHLANQQRKDLSTAERSAVAATINAESVTYVLQERGAKGTAPGLILRTDNSDPATNLGISQVGISIVRSLWQMSQVVAYPSTETSYDYDYSPMPSELFASTGKPPRSVVQTLLHPAPTVPTSAVAPNGKSPRKRTR